MKRILLVTPLYPIFSKENNTTSVCHFFARDWVKMGYEVIVIHIQAEYPWLTRFLMNIRSRISGIVPGGGYFYKKRLKATEFYEVDGVPIYRIPVNKLLPRCQYSECSLKRLSNKVEKILNERGFIPDIITGHMMEWDIIPIINKYNAKTCMVLHGPGEGLSEPKKLWNYYDIYGYRSKGIQRGFESNCMIPQKSFICYSGIPEKYITDSNSHDFSGQSLSKFIYVGDFITRKFPSALMDALSQVYPKKDFSLEYIGKGHLHEEMENKRQSLGLESQVTFVGRIPRDEIKSRYDKADCQIMISEGEAFGLVYLEAMARGCIVIGSKNEGIDGIVEDGVNGFLCEAGNVNELAEIIKRINSLSAAEKTAISNNAIETARKFTDEKAAALYAEDLKRAFEN